MNRPPDSEVAHLIQLYSACKEFNTLPLPGGVLDQPHDLMEGLLLVASAVHEKTERDRKKAAK